MFDRSNFGLILSAGAGGASEFGEHLRASWATRRAPVHQSSLICPASGVSHEYEPEEGHVNRKFLKAKEGMAVFLLNTCKFNGCGRSFSHLGELILHIEEKHIDYDPRVIEQKEQQQPTCLPLSYILRFYSESARKEYSRNAPASPPHTPTKTITTSLNTPVINLKSPPESDLDEEEGASESGDDSDNSWTTPEEFSAEFILKEGSKSASNNVGEDRPFVCPVPGCKKRYKNVNGIKYHAKNGHKKDSGKIRKAHRCPCGKKYRTVTGLKNHTQVIHQASPDGVKTLPVRQVASLAVLDQGFTLLAKGRQGNMVQLGIITPNQQSPQNSTTLTLTPITQKAHNSPSSTV